MKLPTMIKLYLTNYNDNFVGPPVPEVIEEVMERLQQKEFDSVRDALDEIERVCSEMFD